MIARISSLLVLAAALAACSGDSGGAPPSHDAGRTRRVIEPPSGKVRPLPPHAIDPGGIGPYRLAVTQSEVLAALSGIPRIATLSIEDVVDVSVVRAEDDAILVGGRPGEPISFIAALARGIARTESGLGVGATREELAALGPELVEPRAARDPRVVVPAAMPGTRFLLENDAVVAILLRGGEAPAPAGDGGVPEVAAPPGCAAAMPASETDVVAAAGLDGVVRMVSACLTSSGKEAIVTAGDLLVVVDTDGSKVRRLAREELRGLVWAGTLRGDGDRDDLVAITERRTGDEMVLSLHVFRLDGGKLSRLVAGEDVYRITETKAQWIGARVEDLRLLLTVDVRPDGYEVKGVLLHLAGIDRAARDVAPLLPVRVRKRRATDPPAPAPVKDAGAPARDAGVVAPRDQ